MPYYNITIPPPNNIPDEIDECYCQKCLYVNSRRKPCVGIYIEVSEYYCWRVCKIFSKDCSMKRYGRTLKKPQTIKSHLAFIILTQSNTNRAILAMSLL